MIAYDLSKGGLLTRSGLWTFVEFDHGKIREIVTIFTDSPSHSPYEFNRDSQEVYHDFDISDPENPVFVSISNGYTNEKLGGWGVSNGIQYSKENPSPEISEAAKDELKQGHMLNRFKKVISANWLY